MTMDAPRILVAARDADYMRFAAAVLTRAGYAVQTTSYTFPRVQRFLSQEQADVLILEGSDEHVSAPIAVVLVVDAEDVMAGGADAVVAKWAPPGRLTQAVEMARAATASPRARPAPGLRLVEG